MLHNEELNNLYSSPNNCGWWNRKEWDWWGM